MTGLVDRLAAASPPRAFDPARGAAAAELIGASGSFADLLVGAAGSSPYLSDLIAREAVWLAEVAAGAPEDTLTALLGPAAGSIREEAVALRVLKRRAALLIALADLGGVWSLEEVTGALSAVADRAAARAFDAALGAETAGPLAGRTAEDAGLIVLAMGKGGAEELNYSSDIDLVLLYDEDRVADDPHSAKQRWAQVARRAVKILTETTAEGYVFRTDLRLRPNPSVTPIILPTDAAERYYESMGRTWERAAFIKARPAAGDLAAGAAFLDGLAPFIWRRHLDFAALEDINEIRAKIRDAKGLRDVDDLPGYDLKLGPGGIREIEFFAQTQQLAFGGRDPSLRSRGTRAALSALFVAGRIDEETRVALSAAYGEHRRLEHRLQMIADAQTHAIPTGEDAREQVAALSGWPDAKTMEDEVAARLSQVRARVQGFFGKMAPAEVDAPLETVIESLAFAHPERTRDMAERWVDGGVAATRGDRARRKFRALAPTILAKLAEAGDPDDAALHFDRFIAGLPAGAQLFSLFEANPQLLDLLAEICAAAPRLAEYLGRNARVLDAVLDADFFAPLPDRPTLTRDLAATLGDVVSVNGDDAGDYEGVLNGVRAWAKEKRFRVGVQVLRGIADEREAGRAFSDIAEVCVGVLLIAAEREIARRHGPAPGRAAAVVALGKLGSREMTASSDLDLIIVYDAAGEDASDGPRPLTTPAYFARLTKAFISALTTLTAEGALYEVDMRLRPSGGQGPVAVSFESFAAYQAEEAWTWEHMALTRARPIAGDPALRADIAGVIETVLSAPRDRDATRADVAAMRVRLAEAHKADRGALWALKRGAGGLMDIEFAAQNGLLSAGLTGAPAPFDALAALAAAGEMAADDADRLGEAYTLQSRLQQVERVAMEGALRAERVGAGLEAALSRAVDAPDLDAVEARLATARADAAAVVDRLLSS